MLDVGGCFEVPAAAETEDRLHNSSPFQCKLKTNVQHPTSNIALFGKIGHMTAAASQINHASSLLRYPLFRTFSVHWGTRPLREPALARRVRPRTRAYGGLREVRVRGGR